MGPIQVVVQDANNLVLEVTPTPSTTVILDRGIAGPVGPMGDGDVDGPASSTDNAVARFDGTTGKLLQNSNVTIGDTGAVAGVTTLSASGDVTLSGGTANGVAFLNGSKVLTTGSALTFDGNALGIGIAASSAYGKLGVSNGTNQLGITFTGNDPTLIAVNNAGSSYASIISDAASYIWKLTATEAMRLTSSGLEIKQSQLIGYSSYAGIGTNGLAVAGNVGVGTASPTTKLHIANAGATYLRANNTTSTVDLYVGAQTNDATIAVISNHPLTFATNSTEKMHLSAAGNLGLGVTPSAWQSTRRALQVGGSAALWASVSGAGTLFLSNNTYFDGGNFRYLDTSGASFLAQQTDGSFTFNTAPSGTAGNAISFTQAMTLDAGGNLGVGETNPAFRLDVKASRATSRLTSSTGTNAVDFQANNTGGQLLLGIDSSTGGSLFGAGGYTAGLFYSGAYPLIFGTNNAEKMRLSSDGTFRVKGAGTAGSTDAFQVAGTAPADAARITSGGDLLVGTTTTQSGIASDPVGISLYGATANGVGIFVRNSINSVLYINNKTSGGSLVQFYNGGNSVGEITSNGTITIYGTTSDYRLKTVIGPVADAGQRIDALQPVEYTWNGNGTRTRGFLAHQFQEVYASSVSGTKDAVDAEGKPVYQSMQASTSEVIADLVAELQSLRARVASLESSTLQ